MSTVDNEGQSLVEAAIDDLFLWDEGEEVGIDELKNGFAFELFPNPANDQFVIQFDQPLNGQAIIEVINELGQIMKQMTVTNGSPITIPVNNLANGMYVVKMQAGEKTYVDRINIQH